ncbi:MAG: ArsC family reductase [Rhodoferax sp.]|uniref:ArsC family reductase n=1 Tax=Rhodoferax sp. TaxID=50421 RepID=UPI00263682C4|nr:ArsC family reductase [Rhodoferax sp.]MDD5334172.1 ArsC family reductase [Rhodoferax sp.]
MKTQLITLYGIPNCDTVKKARAWLGAQGLDYQFHDFKKQGVPAPALDAWIKALGWEPLVNRRGTSWRRLDDATRAGVTDAASARALMLAQASVIKRPVVEWTNGEVSVGFDAQAWRSRVS